MILSRRGILAFPRRLKELTIWMTSAWQASSSVINVSIELLTAMLAVGTSGVLAAVDAVTSMAGCFIQLSVKITFVRQTAAVAC